MLSDYLRKAFNLPEWGIVPEIKPVLIKEGSSLIGQSLSSSQFRTKTGATIMAMFREGVGTFVPTPETEFTAGDIIHLLADDKAIDKVAKLLA
jgi:K+/H+ antiporter YhaU regulatory subunit KhtT